MDRNGSTLRILAVEDSPADFMLLQRNLAQRGIDANWQRVDHDDALRSALREAWDVVLTDFSVPGMDVLHSVDQIRARDPLLPVILVSGSIGEEKAVELLRAGIADFVLKDRPARLGDAIQRALADSAARRALQRSTDELQRSRAQLQAVLDALPDLLFEVDAQLRIVGHHSPRRDLLAVPPERFLGRSFAEVLPDPAARACMDALHAARRDGWAISAPYPLRLGDAEYWFEASMTWREAPPGYIVLARDVTARRRDEQELRIAATAFESQQGMIVTDPHGVIQRVNRAFTRLTGYTAAEAVGHTPRLLRSGRYDDAFYRAMWQAVARDGYWAGELVNRHKDGELRVEWVAISAVTDAAGAITHYVGSFSDLTQQREAEARAQHLAQYDPLTELPNRALLHDRIAQALTGSTRTREFCAMLLLDLDRFKDINDALGHRAGDQLLLQAAQRMRAVVRDGDTLARFGGDKFAIIMEDLGADAHRAARYASALADKVRGALATRYALGGHTPVCSASIGVSLFNGVDGNVEAVLKQAELAMYRAKTEGRDRVRFFEQEMQSALESRSALAADLRDAIEQQQFVLHYQLQVDRTGRPRGAEALLRWQHPRAGLLLPDRFIGLAEDTGLIEPLGQWVLMQACRVLADWQRDDALRELRLAVNVSPRQFRRDDFVATVLSPLREFGVDAQRLKVEITESLVLDDIDDAVRKIGELKRHGVGISLDDFGTGSSSLAYLTRLPLDQLKIDKSFVVKLPQRGSDAMVAQAVIALGKGLGLDVIAEGVETDAQHAFLLAHGCDAFQGWHFARAEPLGAFEAAVRAGEARLSATPR